MRIPTEYREGYERAAALDPRIAALYMEHAPSGPARR